MSTKKLDYSKWDHIEISDDEDDTHPNIDTPSLFRWRHQARLERMERDQQEKEDFQKGLGDYQQKLCEIKQKLKEAGDTGLPADNIQQLKEQLAKLEKTKSEDEKTSADIAKLKIQVDELQRQEAEFKQKEEELKKKEKSTPLNIDTICKEGKSKTIINKIEPRKREELSEEEKFEKQQSFTKQNEKYMKQFGMMRKYDDSQELLLQQPQLACEETANYLVIWCINLEVEEKRDLMNHVSHQTIVMQFILELAKSLDLDPRSCIRAFFSRIKLAEKQYMDAFNEELESFRERVRKRAQAKIDEAVKQVEEEERQARLGPGGLDPVEVFESLPKELQDCFEKKDISMLQEAVAKMPKEVAEHHIKRCVDSGLWVPNASGKDSDGDAAQADLSEEPVTDEPVTEPVYQSLEKAD